MKLATVPSFPRVVVTDEGTVIGPSGRELKTFPDKDGYRRVTLYLGAKRWQQVGVHFLVCEAFNGQRPEGAHIAHRDGNRANNRADNLSWSAPWQNEQDKRRHGTALLGERHHQAKLTECDVRAIRASSLMGIELARKYGVTPSAITAIRKRRTWAHICD